MIENFEGLKKQLKDLAAVINSFKSEAVQLRIVDLVFQGLTLVNQNTQINDVHKSKQKIRRSPTLSDRKKSAPKDKPQRGRQPKATRLGPGAILNRLFEQGFFKAKRTIADIKKQCKSKFAYTYTTSELSVASARMMRDDKLDRDKNKENQYEYFQK